MAWSRWVLPRPESPYTRSGLYALPGASATATAAAWGKRLDEPITNVSKAYFGFRRVSPVAREGSGDAAAVGAICPSVDISIGGLIDSEGWGRRAPSPSWALTVTASRIS